jgi:hypothetical protein
MSLLLDALDRDHTEFLFLLASGAFFGKCPIFEIDRLGINTLFLHLLQVIRLLSGYDARSVVDELLSFFLLVHLHAVHAETENLFRHVAVAAKDDNLPVAPLEHGEKRLWCRLSIRLGVGFCSCAMEGFPMFLICIIVIVVGVVLVRIEAIVIVPPLCFIPQRLVGLLYQDKSPRILRILLTIWVVFLGEFVVFFFNFMLGRPMLEFQSVVVVVVAGGKS